MQKVDLSHQRDLADAGYISIQQHHHFPLLIHNYTAKTQYEQHWTPATLASRGLITDLSGLIVARPFPKFFNLDEHIATVGPLPREEFDVFEKMDGSLGVLYHWEGLPYLATRGSFQSEQALVGTEILRQRYPQVPFDPDFTYLFEIIYPANRIVVDYGSLHDIILLGKVHTATGTEAPLEDLGIPLVQHYPGPHDLQALKEINAANREGFVVRFKSGLRVKVKFEEYCRLHKILTGFTKRTIWAHLKDGQDLGTLLDQVPDEFYQWVQSVEAELRNEFARIETTAKREFKTFPTRKETAQYFFTCTYPKLLFLLLDGKDYRPLIWQMIYPEHVPPFTNEPHKEAPKDEQS